MSGIVSKPASKEYREEYDRIFGRRSRPSQDFVDRNTDEEPPQNTSAPSSKQRQNWDHVVVNDARSRFLQGSEEQGCAVCQTIIPACLREIDRLTEELIWARAMGSPVPPKNRNNTEHP